MKLNIRGWLRQTTTVQGLAVVALTATLQLSQAVPWPVVLGTAVAAVVLLGMPGQGDLAGQIGQVITAASTAAVQRNPAAIAAAARQGLVLAGSLHPTTPVVPASALAELGSAPREKQL